MKSVCQACARRALKNDAQRDWPREDNIGVQALGGLSTRNLCTCLRPQKRPKRNPEEATYAKLHATSPKKKSTIGLGQLSECDSCTGCTEDESTLACIYPGSIF